MLSHDDGEVVNRQPAMVAGAIVVGAIFALAAIRILLESK